MNTVSYSTRNIAIKSGGIDSMNEDKSSNNRDFNSCFILSFSSIDIPEEYLLQLTRKKLHHIFLTKKLIRSKDHRREPDAIPKRTVCEQKTAKT
jgi:hypothetical protein